MYAAHLPHPEKLPENLRVKFFRNHDVFTAYLMVWADARFTVDSPEPHLAIIYAKGTPEEQQALEQAIAETAAVVVDSSKIWQSGVLGQRLGALSLGQAVGNGLSSPQVTA